MMVSLGRFRPSIAMKSLQNLKKNKQRFFENSDSFRFLIWIFVFLLPTQLGKHFFFNFSYINGVRVDYLAITIYLTDFLSLLIFLSTYQSILKHLSSSLKLLLILVILLLLNIFFSDIQIVSFYNLLKLLQVYLLYFVFKHSKFDRNFLLSAFFWGMILQLLLSLWQLIKKGSVEIGFYWLGERHLDLFTADVAKVSFDGVQLLRPYGTFSHPNSLAGFYLLVYTFVLFFIKSRSEE